MIKNRVILRADGNFNIGLGHVYRLIALAEILNKKFYISFAIKNPDDFIKKEIISKCNEIIELNDDNIHTFLREIKNTDIIVLDGYSFEKDYEIECKKYSKKVVTINDIPDRHFFSDVIINHSSSLDVKNFISEEYTKIFLGTNYSLLRKTFLDKAKKEKIINIPKTIFINLGGSDPENKTLFILKKIITFDKIRNINIVLGSSNIYYEDIKNYSETIKNFKINIFKNLNENDLSNIISSSEIAITSPSTISYEACCIKIGLIIYKTDDNQNNILNFLIQEKLALNLDSNLNNLDENILFLLNSDNINNMIRNQKKFFNGNSEYNINKIFMEL